MQQRNLLVVAMAAVFLAGCGGGSPSASPRSTGTNPSPGDSGLGSTPLDSGLATAPPASGAAESAAPSPDASAPGISPTPAPATLLAPGTAVEVLAVELNLRRQPTTSARRVSLLKRGDVLVISPLDNLNYGWGPVRANGFDWYPVVQLSTADGKLPRLPDHPVMPLDGVPVSGWVAAGSGSDAYIRPLPARCPSVADLQAVSGMLPAERIACFGSNPIVLEGTYGCYGCGAFAPGTFSPAWLATPFSLDFLSRDPSITFGPLALRFAPDGPDRPPLGSIVRVTVHVDDPRAASCSITDGEGPDAVIVPAQTAVQFCQGHLVVDSYEVLGTDPRFPT